MEKVEPQVRQQVLEEIIGLSSVFDAIRSYPTALEVEAAAVDIYVNCDPWASWEHLAWSLHHHHQVAAVEEVRSYFPPRARGEPCFGVYIMHRILVF
jgi:hypothetical protein